MPESIWKGSRSDRSHWTTYVQAHNSESQELVLSTLRRLTVLPNPLENRGSSAEFRVARAAPEYSSRDSLCDANHWKTQAQAHNSESRELLLSRLGRLTMSQNPLENVGSSAKFRVTRAVPECSSRDSQCDGNHWKHRLRRTIPSHESCF